MKPALTKTKRKAGRPVTKQKLVRAAELGIVRNCILPNCDKALAPAQKKFCCSLHRNLYLRDVKYPGAGEPTSYRPEYATTKFEEFLKDCEEKHKPTMIPTATSYLIIHNAKMPTMEEYAEFLKTKVPTMVDWIAKYEPFAVAMDRLKAIQRSYLINNGLSGRYSPQISKLLLGTNHGLIERKQVDNTHKMIGIVKHLYDTADRLEQGNE